MQKMTVAKRQMQQKMSKLNTADGMIWTVLMANGQSHFDYV